VNRNDGNDEASTMFSNPFCPKPNLLWSLMFSSPLCKTRLVIELDILVLLWSLMLSLSLSLLTLIYVEDNEGSQDFL
jgi:hypothetical protein